MRICGVTVGRRCYIGFNVIPDTNYSELIAIGDDVTISHNCTLICHTQSPSSPILNEIFSNVQPITIESGAWVGMNSIILPGVNIASNSFIGAGSVVSKSTHPYTLNAGNPCMVRKHLNGF